MTMNDNTMTAQDYPLATRCPEKIGRLAASR